VLLIDGVFLLRVGRRLGLPHLRRCAV
jgi:hypothetical protein